MKEKGALCACTSMRATSSPEDQILHCLYPLFNLHFVREACANLAWLMFWLGSPCMIVHVS